jgi:O-antigen/teichoic acid export membrane protein
MSTEQAVEPSASAERGRGPDRVGRRVAQGVGAHVLSQVLGTASRVLLVPLFLRAWGADVYGEWLLLSSFAAYLTLTDLGGQLYIVNRLTQAYSKGDIPTVRTVLHTGLALLLLGPALVFVLFMGAMFVVPPESILQITHTGHGTVLLVLGILIFQVCISLPHGLVIGVYRAVGMLPRSVMLTNVGLALQLGLTAFALWFGAGMAVVAALQVVGILAIAYYPLKDLARKFPEFELPSLRHADLAVGRSFIRPSSQFFAIQAARALTLHGTVLLVGSLLGQREVVVFSSLRTMGNVMQGVLALLASAAWPEMTRLDSVGERGRLRTLFGVLLRTTMTAALVATAVFHLYGAPIFGLWLGGHVEYSQTQMDLILGYLLQTMFWTMASYMLMATNAQHHLSRLLVASAPISLLLAYLGAVRYGVPGVIGGTLLGELLLPFWVVPLLVTHSQPQIDVRFFLREGGPVAAAAAAILALPGWTVPLTLGLSFYWWSRCLPRGAVQAVRSEVRRRWGQGRDALLPSGRA